MRTTEVSMDYYSCKDLNRLITQVTKGVWLSLCPTGGQVVVALDFEGQSELFLILRARPQIRA